MNTRRGAPWPVPVAVGALVGLVACPLLGYAYLYYFDDHGLIAF